jgi:pyrroline-5-carboxylate reductase
MSKNIVFVGAGSMAEALLKGMLDRNVVTTSNVTMANRSNEARLQELRERYSVQACSVESTSFALALETADVVVLAMKPKDAGKALKTLSGQLKSHHLLVSVIAGLQMSTIAELVQKPIALVRTMPNTSSTIGLGATGVSYSSDVSNSQKEFIHSMFSSIGIAIHVEEHQLDAVTGLSGSGPAYFYFMMEAMMRAGESLGLDAQTARALTIQTVIGAGEMVKQTGQLPSVLREQVTSPNGTTQAALETLANGQFQQTVEAAVQRATARAAELGQMITEMMNE